MAKIVFLCMNNTSRGQMAAGFARKLLSSKHEIYSAGSHPKEAVHPEAIKAMKEVNIDISKQQVTAISELPIDILNSADFIITLCSSEVCPFLATKAKMLHWPIADPAEIHAYDVANVFTDVRNQIKDKITDLIEKNIHSDNVINLKSAR